jgi:very-short-patch-repair endonuclease
MPRKPLVPPALMHGPFTVVEARQAGLQRWHLEGRSWKRLKHGIYVLAEAETRISTLIAVSKRLPRAAAFSGVTAAWLHGLDVRPCDPVEITIPSHLGVSRPRGVRVRRTLLSDDDVVRIRGFRATAIARTIADISARLDLTEAVVIADAALYSGRVTLETMTRWAAAHSRRPGIRRLRRVIELAEPVAESPMESRLRMLLVLGGLPRPRAQVEIRDANGRFVGRPDLYYDDAKLGIEFDGSGHRNSLVADNHRQNNLLGAGVRLLRFTAVDVMEDPDSVVDHVGALLWGLSPRSGTSTSPA